MKNHPWMVGGGAHQLGGTKSPLEWCVTIFLMYVQTPFNHNAAKAAPASTATHRPGVTHHPGVVGTPARCAETDFPRVSNLHTHHTITLVTGMGCGCGLSKKYKWAPIPQRMKFWKSFKQPRLPPPNSDHNMLANLKHKTFPFWLGIFSRNCSVFIEQEAFLERQEPSGRTFPL